MLLSLSTPMVHLLSQQIALAVDVSGYRTGLLRNFLEFPFLLLPWEQDLLKPPLASMNCSSLEWWILNRHGWSVPTSFQLCYPAYPVIQLSTAWYLSSTSSAGRSWQGDGSGDLGAASWREQGSRAPSTAVPAEGKASQDGIPPHGKATAHGATQ